MKRCVLGRLACGLAGWSVSAVGKGAGEKGDRALPLGNFSVSLSVKDVGASREFYEKLGFHVVFGNQARGMLIMQNETSTIGLFHGMFERNTLTYNPGWDRTSTTLPSFEDVRDIQRELRSRGVKVTLPADETTTGPGFLLLADPDGNPILIDQHVGSPKK
jgi:catechol 2,3-dioxygenase-like lactoylglutathione lyase family enzyme